VLALVVAGCEQSPSNPPPPVPFALAPVDAGRPVPDAGRPVPDAGRAAAASVFPDSPPDWSGARAGDFIEYHVSMRESTVRGAARWFGETGLTLRLEVLSADADVVRVAVRARPDEGQTLPALFSRGLLFAMRRTPPGEGPAQPPARPFGYTLEPTRERVSAGGRTWLCQTLKAGHRVIHGPNASGCIDPAERALYLGGGVVNYSHTMHGIRMEGFSRDVELRAVGNAPPGQEVPPLAFKEGGGYERFVRTEHGTWLDTHVFRTANGRVLDEGGEWSRQPGAKRRRNDRVVDGVRLTFESGPSSQSLLEFLFGLVRLSVHEPFPTEALPPAPETLDVGGRPVRARRGLEEWNNAVNNEAGRFETLHAWDPWELEEAPIQVRFLPLVARGSSWRPDEPKRVTTWERRVLRWE
jgi:hypothetical protein